MCYQLVYIFSIFTQFVKKKKGTISVMAWLACNIGFWWYFIQFPLKVRADSFTDIRSNKSCQVYTKIFILCEENLCGQHWDYWKFRSSSVTWNLFQQDISRDWKINAMLISHSSAVPLSIKVNLIMFLILTTEVLYNGVWWIVCCFNFQWINLCHF